ERGRALEYLEALEGGQPVGPAGEYLRGVLQHGFDLGCGVDGNLGNEFAVVWLRDAHGTFHSETSEVAEKTGNIQRNRIRLLQGLKPGPIIKRCGTTEVVPCYKARVRRT